MVAMKTPPFVTELKDAFVRELKQVGIPAEADFEPVPTTKLFRFIVVAKKFKAMPFSERQDLVWRIADKTLPEDKQLRVSSILTLTPEEAGFDRSEAAKSRKSAHSKKAR